MFCSVHRRRHNLGMENYGSYSKIRVIRDSECEKLYTLRQTPGRDGLLVVTVENTSRPGGRSYRRMNGLCEKLYTT